MKNHQKKTPKGDLSKKKPEQKQPPKPLKPKPKPEQKPPKQAEQPGLLAGKFQEEVNTKIAALSEKILTQDKQQEEANAKITALANAVGSLNENFTKFIDTLKAQATPAQPIQTPSAEAQIDGGDDKPKPGPGILTPKEPEQITPPSAPDKLLAWGELLAKFAQAGGGGGGGVQADAMPNSLVQLVNSLKVMGELRKTFLSELKEMIGFAKGIETTVKSSPARPGGTAHLQE